MWHSIARTFSVDRHLDAWSQARLLALLNITLADGYIAVQAEKYDPTPLQPAAPQPASLQPHVGQARRAPVVILARLSVRRPRNLGRKMHHHVISLRRYRRWSPWSRS
jgi:hypothetical protein